MTMFLCGLQFVYMFSYSFRLVFGRSTNVLLVSRFHDYFFVFLFLAGHLQLGELSQSNQRLELSSTRLDETQRRLDSRLGVISKFRDFPCSLVIIRINAKITNKRWKTVECFFSIHLHDAFIFRREAK